MSARIAAAKCAKPAPKKGLGRGMPKVTEPKKLPGKSNAKVAA